MTSIPPLSTGRLGPPPAPRSAATNGARFRITDTSSSELAGAVAPAAELGGVASGLLSLQAEPEEPDDHARRRARLLLGGLTRLQLRLLQDGDLEADPLLSLQSELSRLPAAHDPRLAEAIAAVAVRVAIELERRRGG